MPVLIDGGAAEAAAEANSIVVDSIGAALAYEAVYQTSTVRAVQRTDATAEGTAVLFGIVSDAAARRVQTTGVVRRAKFTASEGSPANGSTVFLARAADDGATGAGKLRATKPPAGSILVDVGTCFDNTNYAVDNTCAVKLRGQ